MTVLITFVDKINESSEMVLEDIAGFTDFKVFNNYTVYATRVSNSEIRSIKKNIDDYPEIINIKELHYDVVSKVDIR